MGAECLVWETVFLALLLRPGDYPVPVVAPTEALKGSTSSEDGPFALCYEVTWWPPDLPH